MKKLLAKKVFLFIFAVGVLSACTGAVTPMQAEALDPANGIEIIVYTWDWPMMANIPPIHIWKDGHALWVTHGQDNLTHVYETFLSQDEVLNAQNVLSTSGFWEEAQPEATFTQASYLFLWASNSNQEGVASVTTPETQAAVAYLREILESSPNKREYFPSNGYLFISDDGIFSERTYYWPTDDVYFEFNEASQGIYVDGEVVATVWKAIQHDAFWIASQNNAYGYELKIPGISCVISIEPYMCNMYAPDSR
jgi:hypothetical protein